jgi:hypothetical protein
MQSDLLRRREFITLLGGAAAAWPLAARAQGDQVRRTGVLTVFSKSDPEGQRRIAALLHRLQELGWSMPRLRLRRRKDAVCQWLWDQLPTFAQRRPILYFSPFAIFVYSRGRHPPALRQLVRSHQLSPCCAVATVIA